MPNGGWQVFRIDAGGFDILVLSAFVREQNEVSFRAETKADRSGPSGG
jgi:hypothetical protein